MQTPGKSEKTPDGSLTIEGRRQYATSVPPMAPGAVPLSAAKSPAGSAQSVLELHATYGDVARRSGLKGAGLGRGATAPAVFDFATRPVSLHTENRRKNLKRKMVGHGQDGQEGHHLGLKQMYSLRLYRQCPTHHPQMHQTDLQPHLQEGSRERHQAVEQVAGTSQLEAVRVIVKVAEGVGGVDHRDCVRVGGSGAARGAAEAAGDGAVGGRCRCEGGCELQRGARAGIPSKHTTASGSCARGLR